MKKIKSLTEGQKLKESIRAIRKETRLIPRIAIILGSGLGEFADSISQTRIIDNRSIPHYPRSTVEGHSGRLIFGKIKKIPVLAFQGRVHYYETGNVETILYPIRVAKALGIRKLIVTNAAGGINKGFVPGDLMLIADQINLTFEYGSVIKPGKPKKPLYDLEYQERIKEVAALKKIPLQTGTYCGIKGPSYETASEVRMLGGLGADAVGMSTVNEVSLAVGLGMRVAGFSCITNFATGISAQKLSHDEVTEVANKVKHTFGDLINAVIGAIG